MASLRARLDALVANHDGRVRREADPVDFVHRFSRPDDREVVGLVAAFLAFGNIVAVQRSVQRVLDVLGPRPARAIAQGRAKLNRRLAGFVHRVYRAEHVALLLHNAHRLRSAHGSLGDAFQQALGAADIRCGAVARTKGGAQHDSHAAAFREALVDFADGLRRPVRGVPVDRGMRHLVPDPRAGSACKRLLLYLRWMVREADDVDLGLWPVDPSRLVIPVDTHILRIARNLRLTERKDASWRTAEEITTALRAFDSADPVKYDFALCHLGVSRACPSRRDDDACGVCALRPVCRHWS